MPMAHVRPGAASSSLYDVLTGPPRPADVVAAFDRAIYLRVRGAEARAAAAAASTVVAVVGAAGLRLPCAVVLAGSSPLPADVVRVAAEGRPATVGAGRVHLPGLSLAVTRWWRPRRPRPVAAAPDLGSCAAALAAALPPLPAELVGPAGALAEGLGGDEPGRVAAAARRLVGLGPGLTPAGDDLLAALLLTLSAAPARLRQAAAVLAGAVLPDVETRTTSLSAALLRHGARGDGLPQVVDLLDAFSDRTSADAAAPVCRVERLLAVGSSSGAALAHGVLLGVQTIAARAGTSSDVTSLEVA